MRRTLSCDSSIPCTSRKFFISSEAKGVTGHQVLSRNPGAQIGVAKGVSRYKFGGSILYCTDMPMESVWNLHLSRWVIEDGEPELTASWRFAAWLRRQKPGRFGFSNCGRGWVYPYTHEAPTSPACPRQDRG
jgi:hypothetical protein